MEAVNRYTQQHNSMMDAYVACASTGKAAVNLEDTTVHSAFKLTQSRQQHGMSYENLQTFRRLFRNVKCVIIDEISMIGSNTFHRVNTRLQEVKANYTHAFGALHVTLSGDFKQLPPVNASPIYKGNRSLVRGPVLWQSLHYFPLVQVMRQSDVQFSTILTKIGNGQRLTAEEQKLIESRFRTKQWCEENLQGVVRLFHRIHQVEMYNAVAVPAETSYDAKLQISYKVTKQTRSWCRVEPACTSIM
jgi:ATP-dependent exoDNAse (exonuclease V) alpha subunit